MMVFVLERYFNRGMVQPRQEARFVCHDRYCMWLAARHIGERYNLRHLSESAESMSERLTGFPHRASRASHGEVLGNVGKLLLGFRNDHTERLGSRRNTDGGK